MPASGKSFQATELSKQFNIPAFDLDYIVQTFLQLSINEIFQKYGEPYFREVEANVLRSFSARSEFILACGGGTACFSDNIKWMNETGITIWLDPPMEVIVNRLMEAGPLRPLIKENEREKLENFLIEMYEVRKAYYQQAKYRIAESSATTAFEEILRG